MPTYLDLSHTITDGLVTYKGLPAPLVCDFLSHEAYTHPIPDDMTCEKCGNAVFRRFDAHAAGNEAAESFEEETGRDLATTDPAGDATTTDLRDLNNP